MTRASTEKKTNQRDDAEPENKHNVVRVRVPGVLREERRRRVVPEEP